MNGALTYKDLEAFRLKAQTMDEIRNLIAGPVDSDRLIEIDQMIRRTERRIEALK
jgi:hypothetical protein